MMASCREGKGDCTSVLSSKEGLDDLKLARGQRARLVEYGDGNVLRVLYGLCRLQIRVRRSTQTGQSNTNLKEHATPTCDRRRNDYNHWYAENQGARTRHYHDCDSIL